MQTIHADIVIIGAGPAGVCAALAAAQQGMKTVLAGNRPVLGGNSSSETRVWTRGATGGGNLFAEEMGVWGDLKMRNLYTNPDGNPILWDDVLFDRCIRQQNLTLLLNAHFPQVEMQDGRIAAVHGWQMGTEKELRLVAKLFIDCTGDGTIGNQAGVPFQRGKESSVLYQESFAPENEEKTTQGNSILYYVKQATHKVDFIPPSYAYDIPAIEQLIDRGGRVIREDFGGSDYWWFEYGGNLDTIRDAQEISFELRRLVMGVWNYIKNSGKFDAANYTLEWVGSYPGKRESRRMITDHILTQDDVLNRHAFDDSLFYGGWYIDFHPSDGFASENDGCKQIPVQVYGIPLRSLYSSKVPNLLFAGRDIGASHVAFASSRIMNTCALSGHAAGTAAAWCVQNNRLLDTIDTDAVAQIRRTLLRDDMLIPNLRNDDPSDLAQTACVTASSYFDGACGSSVGELPVENGTFITFPAPDIWDVRLLVTASEDTTLTGRYFCTDLPSRYKAGVEAGNISIPVQAGISEWISLPEPVYTEGFVTLIIQNAPHLSIHFEERQRTGLLCGHSNSPVYHYPCLQAEYKLLYQPKNILNGYQRPWMGPNLWIAGEETVAWVQLEWQEPQLIGEVRLYLNPDLSKEIASSRTECWAEDHRFIARDGMPPELLRDFRLQARIDGSWHTLAEVTDNWHRMAVLQPDDTVKADAVRITCLKNWGAAPAQLFEIRVYRQKQAITI